MLRPLSHFKPKRHDVNLLFLNGGLGDHIGGSLIAADYMIKTYTWINFLVWVPDFLLSFSKHILPTGACVRPFSQMRERYNRNLTTKTTEWDGHISPMKIHTVDYAYLKLCDEMPPVDKKNSLRPQFDKINIDTFQLPEKYIIIVVGFTAGVREFTPGAINAVSDYVIAYGYTPVFLGQRVTQTGVKHEIISQMNRDVDFTKGIDLIDKTDLLSAAKIIQGAKAVVAVDCGLMHLAGCTDTAIVGGFTTVHPNLRVPIRRNELGWNCYPVIPEKTLQCRFCQVSTNFLYDHDYKFCIYDDYLCVKSLTPAKFIEQLEKII